MRPAFGPNASFLARRRTALRGHPRLIGIDYVEVAGDLKLRVHFIPAAADVAGKNQAALARITKANLRIDVQGDQTGSYLRIKAVHHINFGDMLEVGLDTDNPALAVIPDYTLELVDLPEVDRFFTRSGFNLRAPGQTASSDPLARPVLLAESLPAPETDYLVKDYAGFRQAMLDRLHTLVPDWGEDHPADITQTLVELLAYAADHASYFQDAVATEAYLGTARRRVSVRRHARLLDYSLHEGCNARVWVQVQVSGPVELPPGTRLLTRAGAQAAAFLEDLAFAEAVSRGAVVFESMHAVSLHPAHNRLEFYDWGANDYSLLPGATSAALRGDLTATLRAGQVLIFEQALDPGTGQKINADPNLRHVVRLTSVRSDTDPLGQPPDQPVTQIRWHAEDALSFRLEITRRGRSGYSIASGNILLADHGRTLVDEAPVPEAPESGRYAPRLSRAPLTFRVPFDVDQAALQPAAGVLRQSPRQAEPAVLSLESATPSGREIWQVLPDLLSSGRFTPAFVVEMEDDRYARLRFGDGLHGKRPPHGARFRADFRIGGGATGNVGRDAICQAALPEVGDTAGLMEIFQQITAVRNPLPAQGGTEPESLAQARIYAPQAYKSQERGVTAADYAALAARHPEVERAQAILRWTGSWYTALVLVVRRDRRPVDPEFRHKLLEFLAPYRLAGMDLNVRGPSYVPLDIAMQVQVSSDYFASAVKLNLQQAFSASDLPDGQRGFFHPRNFSFNQDVYLSRLIAHALQIPGVTSVIVNRFQRWGRPPQDEKERGRIEIGSLEIARLLNRPGNPQDGIIAFDMQGGR